MARPRVFVSSTFYDLKHIRASLDTFIQSLGFDSILSEKGDIPYSHTAPLDASCYREVENADIFVLIVGGRYGSPTSSERAQSREDPAGHYESITRREHATALEKEIPVFILVETAVWSEYHTYLKNSEREVEYVHVQSINVFRFLNEILSHGRNNPVQTFDHFIDIERWLREQWSGLFRDHLHRASSQAQLVQLTDQVAALKGITESLQRYLEELVVRLMPDQSRELIDEERKRRDVTAQVRELSENRWIEHINSYADVGFEMIRDILLMSKSIEDFATKMAQACTRSSLHQIILEHLQASPRARADFEQALSVVGRRVDWRKSRSVLPGDVPIELIAGADTESVAP